MQTVLAVQGDTETMPVCSRLCGQQLVDDMEGDFPGLNFGMDAVEVDWLAECGITTTHCTACGEEISP